MKRHATKRSQEQRAKEPTPTIVETEQRAKEPTPTVVETREREEPGAALLGTRPSMQKITQQSMMLKNLSIVEAKQNTHRERERSTKNISCPRPSCAMSSFNRTDMSLRPSVDEVTGNGPPKETWSFHLRHYRLWISSLD